MIIFISMNMKEDTYALCEIQINKIENDLKRLNVWASENIASEKLQIWVLSVLIQWLLQNGRSSF